MIKGTYKDEEGRVSRLENIRPCAMLRDWIHADRLFEKYEDGCWKKVRQLVTICIWGNHGVTIDKEK